ncbi:hypothetical protein HDU92_005361 [Lobulomyces angularis]|nr:hypothetical protein HDU92_005361 [Lobulomyces angularis]
MTTTSCKWLNCNHIPFSSELDCYNHIKTQHTKSGPQRCRWIIEKSFEPPTSTSFPLITNSHAAINLCNIMSKHRGHFIEHCVSHFSFNLRPLKCTYCGETFRNRQEFKRHEKLNHPDETSKYNCFDNSDEKSDNNNNTHYKDTQLENNQNFHTANQVDYSEIDSNSRHLLSPPYSNIGVVPAFFKSYCNVLRDYGLILPRNISHLIDDVCQQGGRIPPVIETELIEELLSSCQISIPGLCFFYNEAGNVLLMESLIKEFSENSKSIWEKYDIKQKKILLKNSVEKKFEECRIALKKTLISLLQLFWKIFASKITNEDNGQLVDSSCNLNEIYSVGLLITINHQLEVNSLSNRKNLYLNCVNFLKKEIEEGLLKRNCRRKANDKKLEKEQVLEEDEEEVKIFFNCKSIDFFAPEILIWFKFGLNKNEVEMKFESYFRNSFLTFLGFPL